MHRFPHACYTSSSIILIIKSQPVYNVLISTYCVVHGNIVNVQSNYWTALLQLVYSVHAYNK